jgi:site-specific recombinase XerD
MINEADNERDKLILKTLFGTGIRVSGLCNLKYKKLDFSTNSGTVIGKGSKERIISV